MYIDLTLTLKKDLKPFQLCNFHINVSIQKFVLNSPILHNYTHLFWSQQHQNLKFNISQYLYKMLIKSAS